MANSYLTSSLISKEAVAIFKTLNVYTATAYKKYENMFKGNTYAPGNTVDIRLDNYFQGQRGDTVVAEDLVDKTIPLTIGPLYSVPISYKPTDLSRNIVDFSAQYIVPAVRRLHAMIDADCQLAFANNTSHYIGDQDYQINSFGSVSAVNPVLDTLNANGYNRYLALNPFAANDLQSATSLQNSFVSPLNKDITMDASLRRLAGLDLLKSSSAGTIHKTGTHIAAGNITVKVAVNSGTSIVLTGLTQTTGTINVGDQFALAGVYEYDKIQRRATPLLKKFVVKTVSGPADASGDITITVSEPLVFEGPHQNFITPGASPNTIPSNTVANFVTSPTVGYYKNYAYTERGLLIAMPALERMDSPDSYTMTEGEISVRVSKTAEVLDNKNIMRLDVQAAIGVVPDQSVALLSKV